MGSKNYFMPADYRPNPIALTVDETSGGRYWTPKRIRSATEYQFGVYRYAVKIIRERGIRSLVDVGCGVAPKLAWLHERCPLTQITGIDQPNAIAFCKKRYDFGAWYADDFEQSSSEIDHVQAELVIASDVIEHLADPDKLLDYLRNRATADALYLLSTPDRVALHGEGKLTCPNPRHVREWSFDEFRAYLADRGFSILAHFHDFAMRVAPTRLFISHAARQMLPWRPATPLQSGLSGDRPILI